MRICYCNTHTYTVHVETDARTKATHSTPRVLGLSLQWPVSADQPNPTELTRQWFVGYQIESMALIFSPLRFAASAVVR